MVKLALTCKAMRTFVDPNHALVAGQPDGSLVPREQGVQLEQLKLDRHFIMIIVLQ